MIQPIDDIVDYRRHCNCTVLSNILLDENRNLISAATSTECLWTHTFIIVEKYIFDRNRDHIQIYKLTKQSNFAPENQIHIYVKTTRLRPNILKHEETMWLVPSPLLLLQTKENVAGN